MKAVKKIQHMYKFYFFIGLFRKGGKQGKEVSVLCLLYENELFTGWKWEFQKNLTWWMAAFLNNIQCTFLTT